MECGYRKESVLVAFFGCKSSNYNYLFQKNSEIKNVNAKDENIFFNYYWNIIFTFFNEMINAKKIFVIYKDSPVHPLIIILNKITA